MAGMIETLAVAAVLLNPAVQPATISTTVCVANYTATVRPPVTYTNRIKYALLKQRGLSWSAASDYELDHHVPLALGGHPTNPQNLRLQPWAGPCNAHDKDVLESALHRAVCAGTVPLAVAQHAIDTDWPAAYVKYVRKPLQCPAGTAP